MVYRGRILERNWDKRTKEFSSLFKVTSANGFYPPPAKFVWNWFVMYTLYTEISNLRTLKIMPGNFNRIVRSWIRLQYCNKWRLFSFQVQGAMLGKWFSELCQMFSGFCFPILIFRQEGENAICYSRIKKNIWSVSDTEGLKGTVPRDFRLLFFFMNQFPPSPHEYTNRAVSNFFENSRRYSQLKVHHRQMAKIFCIARIRPY